MERTTLEVDAIKVLSGSVVEGVMHAQIRGVFNQRVELKFIPDRGLSVTLELTGDQADDLRRWLNKEIG